AVDANKVLDEMASANNGLNIVMLDACRDNPFAKSFRSVSRGLAIVSSAPTGTFISYSTGPGQVARDGEGRNSPYTGALLQYMKEPGIPIADVFVKVRQKLQKEIGQVPWELSSLIGSFSFIPVKSSQSPTAVTVGISATDDALRAEQAKLEAEREKLQQEKDLFEQKKALDEERRKLEEEKKQLAMSKTPIRTGPKEIDRDGRFIAYDNGTVLDTRTNLMWAAKDNGMVEPGYGGYRGLNWIVAKSYCENYQGGGYSDWRMPTSRELEGLFNSNNSRPAKCSANGMVRITKLIDLNCWYVWASETDSMFLVGPRGAVFNFNSGILEWAPQTGGSYQALPVRSVR
ncbi:MAG: DUF1566 domain-containing protein, partial [Syntrophales bacterium LBB04]|nr:DUF1566 domain-containing protein [Syntrophales bacterium LBB04]